MAFACSNIVAWSFRQRETPSGQTRHFSARAFPKLAGQLSSYSVRGFRDVPSRAVSTARKSQVMWWSIEGSNA